MYKEKEIFYRIHSWSFGDTLAATPTLRRLYYAYGDKINVVTNSKRVFQNNPYAKKLISFKEFDSLVLENSDYEILDSFTHTGRKDERGIEKKYSMIDIRQLHSMDLGFQLIPEQMSYDYYPEPDEYKWDLPEKYVVLHVTSNWANRTWSYSNWNNLIKWLAKHKIFTVVIGMDYSENMHSSISDDPLIKKCPVFDNIYGIDLTNKGSLDDMWHIIDKSDLIVTMDSGPLHIAGTTDTYIIQLGSALDWRYRAPYRNGEQTYKYEFIGGSCQLFCNSNLFYNVETWGTINAVPPMVDCRENKDTYECHPNYQKVIEAIKIRFDSEDDTLINPYTLSQDAPREINNIKSPISNIDYKEGKLTYSTKGQYTRPYPIIRIFDIATGLLRGKQEMNGPVPGNFWWVPPPGNMDKDQKELGAVRVEVSIDNKIVYTEAFEDGTGTEIIINGNKILYGDIDDTIYPTFWEIFIHNEYKLERFNLDKILNPIILDIGGNYGLFTLKIIDQIGDCEIDIVEPSAECCLKMREVFEQVNMKNYNIRERAISNSKEPIFFSAGESSAASTISKSEGIPVKPLDINDMFYDRDHIDLMKVDCEGGELDLFKGITDINLSKVNALVVEYHSLDIRDFILDRLGKEFEIIETGNFELGIIAAIKR